MTRGSIAETAKSHSAFPKVGLSLREIARVTDTVARNIARE